MPTTAGAWPACGWASIARRSPTRRKPSRSRRPTTDLFYKSARVYALAAIVVSAEARKKGQESVLLVTRYQDRAADLLRGAIRMLPADRRSWFVKEVVLPDPDLRTLRRRLTSMDLAGRSESHLAASRGAAP